MSPGIGQPLLDQPVRIQVKIVGPSREEGGQKQPRAESSRGQYCTKLHEAENILSAFRFWQFVKSRSVSQKSKQRQSLGLVVGVFMMSKKAPPQSPLVSPLLNWNRAPGGRLKLVQL